MSEEEKTFVPQQQIFNIFSPTYSGTPTALLPCGYLMRIDPVHDLTTMHHYCRHRSCLHASQSDVLVLNVWHFSWFNKIKNKQFHGSRQTRRLEAEFSVSVGTPPPFQDQGADAAPKAVGGE